MSQSLNFEDLSLSVLLKICMLVLNVQIYISVLFNDLIEVILLKRA